MNAQSNQDKFEKFFPTDQTEGLDKHRTILYDATDSVHNKLSGTELADVPMRELFELYLLAIHWLLIIDKVRFLHHYE